MEGSRATITCHATGFPLPLITWRDMASHIVQSREGKKTLYSDMAYYSRLCLSDILIERDSIKIVLLLLFVVIFCLLLFLFVVISISQLYSEHFLMKGYREMFN